MLRTDSPDLPSFIGSDAARTAVPVAICRSTDAMMLALTQAPARLLLIDAGTPSGGRLDPAEPLLPLLTSPYRDVPRVLLSHDPQGASDWWSRGSGWFQGVVRTPRDGSFLASVLDAYAAHH